MNKRKRKECHNCKYINEHSLCFRGDIDKRQQRKLMRTSDKYGIWERFYCKSHKHKKD
ncbi:hypothetical protein [Tissierella sp. P1]|uniref:hypothetical protein n=1 Tax=Tissierella sp. P1 TaxID=1280483 RepID=UPI001302EC24|nr:hypothetical protein [Tissierella sp. P1]